MKKKDIDKIEEKNVNQISMEDSMCLGSVSLDKKKQLNDNKEKNKNINEILSEIEAD